MLIVTQVYSVYGLGFFNEDINMSEKNSQTKSNKMETEYQNFISYFRATRSSSSGA
jgi:hypothetical protein